MTFRAGYYLHLTLANTCVRRYTGITMSEQLDVKTWIFWMIAAAIVAGLIMWWAREMFVLETDLPIFGN